jgi:hypothetical protein
MDVGNLFRGAGRFIVRQGTMMGMGSPGKSIVKGSVLKGMPNAYMYYGGAGYAAYGGIQRKRRGDAFFSPLGLGMDFAIGAGIGRGVGLFQRGRLTGSNFAIKNPQKVANALKSMQGGATAKATVRPGPQTPPPPLTRPIQGAFYNKA